jgi:tripeptide aminopeptidase
LAYPEIINDFLAMVGATSHSRQERLLADLVKTKLTSLGCEVREDGVGTLIGGDTGNVIARLPGSPKFQPIMFSAHLDRVSNPGQIVALVNESEDRITSDGTTILGADDAAGIAAILDGVRRVNQSGVEHGDVEIVLTVAEEVGLQGSKRLDYSTLRSKIAFVIDSNGPIGFIVNRAPTQKTVKINIEGLASHAGIAPEKGISAIRVAAVALSSLREGRLSPISTSNFGVIKGGEATNIVCQFVELKGEARSHDEGELSAYLVEVEEAFRRTAREAKAKVELKWTHEYSAFYVKEDEKIISMAVEALESLGVVSEIQTGGGGMDGNHFNQNGIKSIGLSSGCNHIHSAQEEQSISQLITAGKMVAKLIELAPLA